MGTKVECACELCALMREAEKALEAQRREEIANTIDALEVTQDIWGGRQHVREKWAELLREFAEAWPKE